MPRLQRRWDKVQDILEAVAKREITSSKGFERVQQVMDPPPTKHQFECAVYNMRRRLGIHVNRPVKTTPIKVTKDPWESFRLALQALVAYHTQEQMQAAQATIRALQQRIRQLEDENAKLREQLAATERMQLQETIKKAAQSMVVYGEP